MKCDHVVLNIAMILMQEQRLRSGDRPGHHSGDGPGSMADSYFEQAVTYFKTMESRRHAL